MAQKGHFWSNKEIFFPAQCFVKGVSRAFFKPCPPHPKSGAALPPPLTKGPIDQWLDLHRMDQHAGQLRVRLVPGFDGQPPTEPSTVSASRIPSAARPATATRPGRRAPPRMPCPPEVLCRRCLAPGVSILLRIANPVPALISAVNQNFFENFFFAKRNGKEVMTF